MLGLSPEALRGWASTDAGLGLCSLELGAAMGWCLIHPEKAEGACGRAERVEACIGEVTTLYEHIDLCSWTGIDDCFS